MKSLFCHLIFSSLVLTSMTACSLMPTSSSDLTVKTKSSSMSANAKSGKSDLGTELQAGDQIDFIYSGRMHPQPMRMTQTVLSKNSKSLGLGVQVQTGRDVRQWRQMMMMDEQIPVNKKTQSRGAGYVSELLEMKQGRLVKLGNFQNQDIERLYAGTYLPLEGEPELVSLGSESVVVCGESIPAVVKVVRQTYKKHPILMKSVRSPKFKWDQIRTEYIDEKSKSLLLKVEASRCRRQKN